MAKKYLIINADDFGWTESINEGIIEAHRNGILTSATLLANSKATDQAIELAKENPRLGVGVHLSYNLDKPILPAGELKSLYHADGSPKFSTAKLWLAATVSKKVRDQLYRHFRSQVERLTGKGVAITHFDTHKHVHYWPAVFELVAKLACEFNIPAVRLMRENTFDPGPLNLKTRAALCVLSFASFVNMRIAESYQRRYPQRFIGISQTGYWTKEMFLDISKTFESKTSKPGVIEIMTHPGFARGLENEPTRLVESRLAELNILTDKDIKEWFAQCQPKINLISYRNFPISSPPPAQPNIS
jgi:predicted glycoside hydrolase/deacetylase ChbG (UPF0249 family)